MPLVRRELASGSTLDEALARADELEQAMANVPPGRRVELRLELAPAVIAGVDWSEIFVRDAVQAINAVDGLALWVARQTGRPLTPWPGEEDLAFGFFDERAGRWVLAVRWVTASVWFAIVIRFLIQVSITLVAAGVVIWLAQAIVRWSFAEVQELAQVPGLVPTAVAVGLAWWFLQQRRASEEAGRRGG